MSAIMDGKLAKVQVSQYSTVGAKAIKDRVAKNNVTNRGGHWKVMNTAIPQIKSPNTAIPQIKSPNTAIP